MAGLCEGGNEPPGSLKAICKRLRWAGHVARMGESRNAYRVLVGRPEEKRPLGRPRRRLEDNIKMDLREVGYDDRDWINLAQDWDRWRAYWNRHEDRPSSLEAIQWSFPPCLCCGGKPWLDVLPLPPRANMNPGELGLILHGVGIPGILLLFPGVAVSTILSSAPSPVAFLELELEDTLAAKNRMASGRMNWVAILLCHDGQSIHGIAGSRSPSLLHQNERSAEYALFFLDHSYSPFDFLAAAYITAYSTPQVSEAVHLLYCLI
ncbi:hypothetical protein ANN_22922 [Periplaneta americana]|uniref:Uncharacterized protein n=1 Tax=Periplaneta americana TaxID=6978 RepID=A0ABQ8SK37_PERAM|nr:hypothetical protein ANN_22922 [Periplaneta americana]